MTLKEAIPLRHTVRKFKDEPLPENIIEDLNLRITDLNSKLDLDMSLKTEDKEAFSGAYKLMGGTVTNYIILTGEQNDLLPFKIGYASADLMLYSQTLGLNTWYIAATFNKKKIQKQCPDAKVLGILALGYGVSGGKPHKSKTLEQIGIDEKSVPDWMLKGAKAALDAPTALNRQDFKIKYNDGKVEITADGGELAQVDLGIATYFFEVGSEHKIMQS